LLDRLPSCESRSPYCAAKLLATSLCISGLNAVFSGFLRTRSRIDGLGHANVIGKIGEDPELASYLRIEERELDGGAVN